MSDSDIYIYILKMGTVPRCVAFTPKPLGTVRHLPIQRATAVVNGWYFPIHEKTSKGCRLSKSRTSKGCRSSGQRPSKGCSASRPKDMHRM